MTKVIAWIATIGENPNFVAFMAHCFFAYFAAHQLVSHGVNHDMTGLLLLAVAAAKEFYFDLKYEKDPPQTIKDSALDFAGYMTGVCLGVLV